MRRRAAKFKILTQAERDATQAQAVLRRNNRLNLNRLRVLRSQKFPLCLNFIRRIDRREI